MSRIRTRAATTAAVLGLAAAPAGIANAGQDGHGHGGHPGHDQASTAPAPAPAPAPVDAATFVRKATASNTFEVTSSRLALDRAKDPGVRRIAEHLIADHTTAQEQLAATAREAEVDAPAPFLDPAQQTIVDELSGLRGKAFDRAYLQAQVPAHEQAIALFTGFASVDANPRPLRVLAVTTLPILGSHLGEVRAELDGAGGHGH
jgi:putative membrane protein